MSFSTNQIRWYDRYPNLKQLLVTTETLPKMLQEQIGAGLYTLADRYKDAINQQSDLKSIGSDAVLNLYKSKRRQRWYDEVPQLHDALNILLLLPDAALRQIDENCTHLVAFAESQKAKVW